MPAITKFYLAVDEDGEECKFTSKPFRAGTMFVGELGTWDTTTAWESLETGTIEKLIGKILTWDDEPVKYELGDKE